MLYMFIKICEIQNKINAGTDRDRKIRENPAEQAAGRTASVCFCCIACQLII